jgi:ribonuclease HII
MKKTSECRSGQRIQATSFSCELETIAWKNNEIICGIDEAGRGCMAGPVVIAAAILHPNTQHPLLIDSKKLKSAQLTTMFTWLQSRCWYTISVASSRIIDRDNIYQATATQMKQVAIQAVHCAPRSPSHIVVDAMPLKLSGAAYQNITIDSFIKGESRSISIAAASILAKVTRDQIMYRLSTTFPAYTLHQHKGYCTKLHQNQVIAHQPSIIHRTSYLSWMYQNTVKDIKHGQQSIFC